MTTEEEIVDEIAECVTDPQAYVRFAYPWLEEGTELQDAAGPRTWQADILGLIRQHLEGPSRYNPLQIAISSGHGIGKSALISMIMGWGMSTCEDCRIVVTAGTGQQLDTKTWPEVTKWFKSAINTSWFETKATSISVRDRDHERLWRADAITWSENNTEAFAGLHNKGKRIIVIFDEASQISDKIWEVTEGALTDEDTEIIWLAFGNPTRNTGRFRECFGRFKHRWHTRQIDSRTVEGTNKELFAGWVADWGEDHDFVRVRVKGEFPRAGTSQFISGDDVAGARARHFAGQELIDKVLSQHKVLSVDVARFGDDQTVIGYRQGLKLTVLEKIRGQDTFQIAQRTMYWMKKEVPRLTVVDATGVGAGVVDVIRNDTDMYAWFAQNKPCRLHDFHSSGAAMDLQMYVNARAEVWGVMRDWLKSGDIPDDPELDADLTGPEYFFTARNQIQLEPKDAMKKRGLASPDTGDMLAMTFARMPTPETQAERDSKQMAEAPNGHMANIIRLRIEAKRKGKQKAGRQYF